MLRPAQREQPRSETSTVPTKTLLEGVAYGVSAHDNLASHRGSLQEAAAEKAHPSRKASPLPAQAGGALQAPYHGHRAGSAAPEEGLTLIHTPAKRHSGRANPCHAASSKSLDIPTQNDTLAPLL